MIKDFTELVFILDRSGSMSGLKSDTIGGFNSMLERQKNEKGLALVSTVLFNSHTKVLHNRKLISEVNKLTPNDYYVGGATALLDAVGKSISHILNKHLESKDNIPEKTMFVIMTDGYENDSVLYTYPMVKDLIQKTKEMYGWEYVFLGANIDVEEEARKFGLEEENAVRFNCDEVGVGLNFQCISEAISNVRVHKKMDKSWRNKIDRDYQQRK